MEVLRVGIRNIVGIIIPGGFFCLLLFWGFFGIFGPFQNSIVLAEITTFPDWLLVTILIIISYITGNVLRLTQADKVDYKSGKFHQQRIKTESIKNADLEQQIKEIEKLLDTGNLPQPDPKKFKKKLHDLYNKYSSCLYFEKFPYPKWQATKRILLHSENYQNLFKKYHKGMTIETKEFFNFCKVVVSELSSELREEIFYAESLTRFFAGVYFSIINGIRIVSATAVIQLVHIFFSIFNTKLVIWMTISTDSFNIGTSTFIFAISIIMLSLFYYIQKEILRRFRYIRLKEVDTVYDAFYVVCKRHPEIEF